MGLLLLANAPRVVLRKLTAAPAAGGPLSRYRIVALARPLRARGPFISWWSRFEGEKRAKLFCSGLFWQGSVVVLSVDKRQ